MPDKRRGRPPKLGDHKVYPLRLPATLHLELRHFAIDEACSLNDVLVGVIQGWWKSEQRKASRGADHGDRRREGRSVPSKLRLRPK